jgi:alternate signal-mediated exported protein
MNRTTKGALAGGAAAVLLLGGVGTLAFWTDTVTVDGTDVASGHLKLVTPDCVGWELDGGTPFTGAELLVPGDTLTQVCDYTVDAGGEHLAATFTATGPTDVTGDAPLVAEIGFAATYAVNGSPVAATGVSVVDDDVVTATLTITWPYGTLNNASNVLEGLTASLADVTVVATQTHAA